MSTRFSLSMEMSRLTRDGTAEPISRDQILRHARGQGNIISPVQLTTSRIGNQPYPIDPYSAICDDHTYKQVSLIPPWEDQREWHRMTRMTRPDCAVMCNLINIHTYIHTYIQVSLIPPWEDQCEWHRMTRMTGPDCAVTWYV